MKEEQILSYIKQYKKNYEKIRTLYESNNKLLREEFVKLLLNSNFIENIEVKFEKAKVKNKFDDFNKATEEFMVLLEKLHKEAVTMVKIGKHSYYKKFLKYKTIDDKKSEDKVKTEGKKNEKVKDPIDEISCDIKFLKKLRAVLKENGKGEEIFKEFFNKISHFYQGNYIKLFSCLFPDEVLPIFKKDEVERFLSYFGLEYEGDFPRNLMKLRKLCKDKLCEKGLLNEPSHIVAFLYLYSPFFDSVTLDNELQKLNFHTFPHSEEGTIGIFLAMIYDKNYAFPEYCSEFNSVRNLTLQSDYPDYIVEIDCKDNDYRSVYIEFEYKLEKFELHCKEDKKSLVKFNAKFFTIPVDYVIYWSHDKKKIETYKDIFNDYRKLMQYNIELFDKIQGDKGEEKANPVKPPKLISLKSLILKKNQLKIISNGKWDVEEIPPS